MMTDPSQAQPRVLDGETADRSAEMLRLALARLAACKLPVNPVNYALMYFYVSGRDTTLNKRLDAMMPPNQWDNEDARSLFSEFICECSNNEYRDLREELLMTVAQILGSVIDLTGKAEASNRLLEKHVKQLAETSSAREILNIASNIIADTRDFIDQSRQFENNLVESTSEISLLKDELDQARRMATTDALTGLFNRRGFDQALAELISKSKKGEENFCLLIIDIDHFKTVNDNHGHLVGDKVLIGISKLLHQHMRGNDHLSRFGGEEFAVLLWQTPITGAFTVAENLRKSVERLRLKHVKTGVELDQVTISIGLSCYRSPETIDEFIQRCDKALYRAKSRGRNRTIIGD
jgi:diguanylate cyclase